MKICSHDETPNPANPNHQTPRNLLRGTCSEEPAPRNLSDILYTKYYGMHDLDEVAAEAAGIMAATAELHERLVQGHRQRPRGDQDAHAYHGRATVRRIRARLDAVGNRPPPESQHPDADAARLAKARQEATEIVAAFERWDRRRQRQPHTKSTEHDGNHHV